MINEIGKSLIFVGLLLVAIGAVILLAQKFPWIGRLPGDIHISKKEFTFYFPITTCILISAIISLIFLFLRRR